MGRRQEPQASAAGPGPSRRRSRTRIQGWLALALATAAPAAAQRTSGILAPVERAYLDLLHWEDRARLLGSLGSDRSPEGLTRSQLHDSLTAARDGLAAQVAALGSPRLEPEEVRAFGLIREALDRPPEDTAPPLPATCAASPAPTLDGLSATTIACYGVEANRIIVAGDTLNRLAVLGALAQSEDPARRRALFLSLAPMWRSVDGEGGTASPYRRLVALRRAAWQTAGSPIDRKGPAFGLPPAELERWLVRALEAWRRTLPDTLVEPWDWYHATGTASRGLASRLRGLDALRRVNRSFFADVGADPARLGVRYDLEARAGKYPVAFTDFGSHGRWPADGGWRPVEPWVFTSYLGGSFDNLVELLHETGHAIHIAAIAARPALLDWPDNDTFTEALADVPALEAYEPAWQLRYLGDSVPLAASLRAKYATVILDMAWALFEIRVHRADGVDPNQVWADLTSTYLGILPHPEWAWWAMRGQLIDSPGYLINYALGAFMAADIRARIAERHGPAAWEAPDRYAQLAHDLFRFGRSAPSREVLERFLGRPLRPDPLLADLARIRR